MGTVKYDRHFHFPSGDIWIIWDNGEEDEYGYEIDMPIEGEDGILQTALNYSFGYEDWSYDIWMKWGQYLETKLEAIEGDDAALEAFLLKYEKIDCIYMKYQMENGEGGTNSDHLVDLGVIKELCDVIE